MIDWHSHILPAIDDGSRNVKESIKLLDMLSNQDIDTVIATPHFIADDMSVDEFIEKREKAYQELKPYLNFELPNIVLGAEVKYYQGISRLEGLEKLCIEGTNLLLLEMPLARWTELVLRELQELASSQSIVFVLAHIERYLKYQPKGTIDELCESGILMQVNASLFKGYFSKRIAFSMLKNKLIHFIGSDCHGVKVRPPRIGEAFEVIGAKFGQQFLNDFNEFGKSVLVEDKLN